MLSAADIREGLHTAAIAAFGRDLVRLDSAESWLNGVPSRDLLRIDRLARQFRYEGPTLGKSQQWTRRVLSTSLSAAALATMHPDGFVRERAVRVLAASTTPLADRMLALRCGDHVVEVRQSATEVTLARTDLDAASRIVPVLQRFEVRDHGNEARVLYMERLLRQHGEGEVWANLRGSEDRDVRRVAFRSSLERGLVGTSDAVGDLPRERDQVVRRMLAEEIAATAEPDVVAAVLLHARSAESRALGLVRLNAAQLDPQDVEQLLLDSSVLVRLWARRRWQELGNDVVVAYRRATRLATKPAQRALAYVGLAETGASIERIEVLDLVHSKDLALRKVGLRLLASRTTRDDVPELLELVAADHSRIARLASDALAQNQGLWSVSDLAALKTAADPALRRRGWWLHRTRGGWEAVIADLEILLDPDRHVAALGRQPTAPMYFPPSEPQRARIAELLPDSELSRERKLAIALAAGLRDLLHQLQDSPRSRSREMPSEPPPVHRAGSWWHRIWRRDQRS